MTTVARPDAAHGLSMRRMHQLLPTRRVPAVRRAIGRGSAGKVDAFSACQGPWGFISDRTVAEVAAVDVADDGGEEDATADDGDVEVDTSEASEKSAPKRDLAHSIQAGVPPFAVVSAATRSQLRSDHEQELREMISQRLSECAEPEASATKTHCLICREYAPLARFPQTALTVGCSHTAIACWTCTYNLVAYGLRNGPRPRIACPSCSCTMTFEDIQRFATPTAFKNYEKYLFITAINAMPDYVWCLRPGCGAGQIHSTPGVPIFKCGACGFLQCVKHEVPWHDGQSCRAYDRKGPRFKIITEKASSAQVRSTSKTCPGINCGAKIFRSGGCDHMTCSLCHLTFCWACRAPFDSRGSDGRRHRKMTCKLYKWATSSLQYASSASFL